MRDDWSILKEQHVLAAPARHRFDGPGGRKPGVLVTDCLVPLYDNDAGSLYMWNLIRLFLELNWSVTFYPDNLAPLQPYTSELQQMGVEVIHGRTTFQRVVCERRGRFDLALLRRPDHAFNKLDLVRALAPAVKIIYDTVDLHFLREERRAAIEGDPGAMLSSARYRAMELYLARFSDLTFVVTGAERQQLLRLDPSLRVAVIPIVHQLPDGERPALDQRAGILFLGNYAHTPNVDAVRWFVGEIWPLIRRKLPDAVFYITGSNAPDEFSLLETVPGVSVAGWVPDAGPWFDRCRLFVSPLRYGAGMKGKIAHAMSYGLPVVTTGVGAEGMRLGDGETALLADTPEGFADAVIRLYGSGTLWQELASRGVAHVRANYAPEAVKVLLATALRGLGLPAG